MGQLSFFRRSRMVLFLLMIGLMSAASATDYYVNGTTGNNSNNGLQATVGGPGVGPFLTIGHAITTASATDTIFVAAGDYAENLIVNKALTLQGPNAGVDPCSQIRGAEAIIRPGSSDPFDLTAVQTGGLDPSDTNARIIRITASNVTITGFTLDGRNGALTYPAPLGGNLTIDGVTYHAIGGITNAPSSGAAGADVNNIIITHNIIQYFPFSAINLDRTPNLTLSTGNIITNNYIDTILNGFGFIGIYNVYAKVNNNCMTNVWAGVEFRTHTSDPSPFVPEIRNNIMQTVFHGIKTNNWDSVVDLEIAGNFMTDALPGYPRNTGMMFLGTGGTVNYTSNTVTSSYHGAFIWNADDPNTVLYNDNNFTGNVYGVMASNRINVDMGLEITQSANLGTLPLGLYESSAGGAMFPPTITAGGLTNVEVVQEAGNEFGCNAFTGGVVGGKIVLIRDGDYLTPGQVCNPAHAFIPSSFVQKVRNAQAAGAAGVIFINYNQEDRVTPVLDPFPVPEDDGTTLDTPVTIPCMMVSDVTGGKIETALGSGVVRATFIPTPYTPNVFQGAPGVNEQNISAVLNGGSIQNSTQAAIFSYDAPVDASRLGVDIGAGGPGDVDIAVTEVLVTGNALGILARNEGADMTIQNSIIAANTAGAQTINKSTNVSTDNVYWGSATGPNPPGTGDSVTGMVDTAPHAYWGGSLRLLVSTSGGTFILPVFINDRFTEHELTIPSLPGTDRLTFFPPADRHGADNAIEIKLENVTSIPGSSLQIEYDPTTDSPGAEKYMHAFKWNEGTTMWDYIGETARDEANNTLTASISTTGIYAARWDDSIEPLGLSDWTLHK